MSSRPSSHHSSERTPLLSRQDEESQTTYSAQADSPVANSPAEDAESPKKSRRWPTIIALIVLCFGALFACVGFIVPGVVEEYAKEAAVFEPTKLSIDSFTSVGVRARVQGILYMDAEKVDKHPVRNVGRFATWIAREAECGDSDVDVYLPEYDRMLLGTARLPSIKINIRNQHYNYLDLLVDLEPGEVGKLKDVAEDWTAGKLQTLVVDAVAKIPLKSGLINIGQQIIKQELVFQGKDVPAMPHFNVEKLKLVEHGQPGHPDGVKANALVSIDNDYPLRFDVPALAFQVLLKDCFDDYHVLGSAKNDLIHIIPHQNISASVTGLIRQLPTSLTTVCPNTNVSPIDNFIGNYLAGRDTRVYIRGGEQDPETPAWIGKLLADTTLPFMLPGHPFDNLIKNFELANVHFSLPALNEDHAKISATIKVLVQLPEEMNFNLSVDRVRADTEVFYHGKKMGTLDLREWQSARTRQIGTDVLVESDVVDAPLEITDEDVFAEVAKEMVWGRKGVTLGVKALVDVNTATALGEFVIRNIPSEGQIFIKPITSEGDFEMPGILSMEVADTTKDSLILTALVNLTNPTEYSAHIPHMNVSIFINETRVGYSWASADIVPGVNNITMFASWEVGAVGREWLSQFISGRNTSMTIKTHKDSMRGLPDIGMVMTIPTPKMMDEKFLKEATMHIVSSTATFIIVSPFAMFITDMSAVAYYNGTQLGTIDWEYPIEVPRGESETPRLPVAWELGTLKPVKEALGGMLKLDAIADCGVKIGQWQERLWYEGNGIGAKIRF